MKKDGYDRWQYDEYEILQVIPASGYVAVFCEDDGSFVSEPVRLLALCEVTTHYLERRIEDREKWILGKPYRDPETERKVTPLLLGGGSFCIAAEMNNYAGTCMEGDDIDKADGCLRLDLFEKHEAFMKSKKATE